MAENQAVALTDALYAKHQLVQKLFLTSKRKEKPPIEQAINMEKPSVVQLRKWSASCVGSTFNFIFLR